MQDASRRNRIIPPEANNRATARARAAPSFLYTKGRRNHLAFVCILAGVAVGAAAAITTGIYMRRPHEGKDLTPFCCPGLARKLASCLNNSIVPCKDFFSYVCSNTHRGRRREEKDVKTEIAQSLITGASSKAMTQGDTGRFLTSFYTSCVKTLAHPKSFFQSIARTLSRDVWEHQEPVDTRKAILYIFTASIKYKLPSAVSVSIIANKSMVFIKSWTTCRNKAHHYDAMTAVVDALNERANSTILSSDAAFRFRRKVCKELSSSRRNKRQYTTANESHQIGEELWNTDDLDAGLSVYGSSMRSAKFVSADGVRQIRFIHDQFASEKRNSTATAMKVAFLVWHSVVHGTQDLTASSDDSPQMMFSVCQRIVSKMNEVWGTFAAEMLTSAEKDAVSRAVFTAVKRSVYADIRTSLLLDADDAERLQGFFENLTLVTPIEESQISIAVPKPTKDFGENLIRGRSYDFLLGQEREANLADVRKIDYEEVRFRGEGQLLLSSSIYGYISAGSSDYELPNNARLGRLLAEAIWYMVLAKIEWTSRSRANINRFKKCFVENYLGDLKTDVTESFVAIVLGLSSVVNALNKSDWETLKPAWSLWRISNAQFFFMLSTYYRCPAYWWPKTARLTNVSLLYNEDFTTAFQCPFSAPMSRTRQCFENRPRALKP